MKYKEEQRATFFAAVIILLVITFAIAFGASCTSNKDLTTITYVVTDKYFDTDNQNNEHCYLKVLQLSNKDITIEQLYDHQTDMWNIGDTIIVQLK